MGTGWQRLKRFRNHKGSQNLKFFHKQLFINLIYIFKTAKHKDYKKIYTVFSGRDILEKEKETFIELNNKTIYVMMSYL